MAVSVGFPIYLFSFSFSWFFFSVLFYFPVGIFCVVPFVVGSFDSGLLGRLLYLRVFVLSGLGVFLSGLK